MERATWAGPNSLLDRIPGEEIERIRALADDASSSMAKKYASLRSQALPVENSPRKTSDGTLILQGFYRMCLRSHSFVMTVFVLSGKSA
jgi:hypothetical protein